MIVVGCPVRSREWVLPDWFDHVEKSLEGHDFSYAFALDFGDEDSLALIDAKCAMFGRQYFVTYESGVGGGGNRAWHNQDRLRYMSGIRNRLLGEVRKLDPDFFLSLDSDILITKESFDRVYSAIASGEYDAVAGKTYLSKGGTRCVNAGSYSRQRGLNRSPAEYLCPVDVIMAYKLMNRSAYNIDYMYHHLGEDIGWSLKCKADGLKLGFEGTVPVKHVMSPDALGSVDRRVGY